jgi:epoxyqueuosine reductase QueG
VSRELGAWLEERAREAGFDDAAVVPASTTLPDIDRVRDAIDAGRMGPLTWMTETKEQRLDITKRLPWAKSVLVVLASYWTGDHASQFADPAAPPSAAPPSAAPPSAAPPSAAPPAAAPPMGSGGPPWPPREATALPHVEGAKVSRYAWGQDYHHVLRRKLRRVRKELLARVPGAKCAPFNDVDAVLERAWAEAAGLGFIGKSAMLISKSAGTWTFIGGLVTDVDLGERVRPLVTDACGSCTACLDACPTNAIVSPRVVDARKCLVTWNVEEPDAPEGDAPGMTGHGWAVGCDVCQEVCPWNKFAKPALDDRFKPRSPSHVSFTPETAPVDVEGTPLARPGKDALPMLAARALKRST